jgi:integrase
MSGAAASSLLAKCLSTSPMPASSDRDRWVSGGVQVLVENATRTRFGHPVNVHLFRDCAATSLADEHPEYMRVAADLLGHRSFATTQRYYIASGQRRALGKVQASILRYRRDGPRRPALAPAEVCYPIDELTPWRTR